MMNSFKNDENVFVTILLWNKTEERNFNITNRSGKSSFIKVNSETSQIKDKYNEIFIVKTEKVKIIKLDDYIKEKQIDIIDFVKIDAQLYEDKILEGGLKSLENNKIKIIEEIIFNDYYEKYFSFSDIEKYLISNNFQNDRYKYDE